MNENVKSNFGKKKLWFLLALFVVGILLVFIGNADMKDNDGENEKNISSDMAYIENIENKICNMIAKASGDKSACVMLTLDYGTERRYISNGDDEYVTVKTSTGYELVLAKEIYPEITGISVVCEGGDRAELQKKLIDIISTALGVPSNKICIKGSK